MKKVLLTFLLICNIFAFQPVIAKADDVSYYDIKLLYVGPYTDYGPQESGEPKILENVPRYIFPSFDQRPFIKDGKTYLPLRLTFHILGYQVDWKKDDNNIIISNAQEKMVLNTSTKKITVGDKTLDMPLVLMKDSYFVPLRDFSKVTGDDISWDDITRTVIYVKNRSNLLKPSVTITDVQYKKGREINKGTYVAYVTEITYIIKNTSGETIPKGKLFVIRDTKWPGITESGERQYMTGGHSIYEDIPSGGLITESTVIDTVNGDKGTYQVLIIGVYGKDSYLEGINYNLEQLP